MAKHHLTYINSEPILALLVSGEITHFLANKVSTSKENDKYERILVSHDIYEILLEKDNYIYIYEEFYRNGLPTYGKYKYINNLNQNISIFHKDNYVIVDEFKYVDNTPSIIVNKFIDENKKFYLDNYYIYDDISDNYLVPNKDALKNNKFVNPKSYTNKSVFIIDRNYITTYFNITAKKPNNIFDLFDMSTSSNNSN
jgi:hypothetical protein